MLAGSEVMMHRSTGRWVLCGPQGQLAVWHELVRKVRSSSLVLLLVSLFQPWVRPDFRKKRLKHLEDRSKALQTRSLDWVPSFPQAIHAGCRSSEKP